MKYLSLPTVFERCNSASLDEAGSAAVALRGGLRKIINHNWLWNKDF